MRHCERSEAIQSSSAVWIAASGCALLAIVQFH